MIRKIFTRCFFPSVFLVLTSCCFWVVQSGGEFFNRFNNHGWAVTILLTLSMFTSAVIVFSATIIFPIVAWLHMIDPTYHSIATYKASKTTEPN